MTWERVYTVHAYYDGPRFGVADLDGVPHIYESAFDDMLDDYPDTYKLSKIEDALMSLVMSDWAIWERWEKAFREGKVDSDSHPCLPEDEVEHLRLKEKIASSFVIDEKNFVERRAKFRQVATNPRRMEVEWQT